MVLFVVCLKFSEHSQIVSHLLIIRLVPEKQIGSVVVIPRNLALSITVTEAVKYFRAYLLIQPDCWRLFEKMAVTILHKFSFILLVIITSTICCSDYNAAFKMAKTSSLFAILGESGIMKLPAMLSDNS